MPAEGPPPVLILPDPAPIDSSAARGVEWTVLTAETLPIGENWVFFAMTPEAYERLSAFNAEMLRWVLEADGRLQYYREQLGEAQDEAKRRSDNHNEP